MPAKAGIFLCRDLVVIFPNLIKMEGTTKLVFS